jgi:hypothetical protein
MQDPRLPTLTEHYGGGQQAQRPRQARHQPGISKVSNHVRPHADVSAAEVRVPGLMFSTRARASKIEVTVSSLSVSLFFAVRLPFLNVRVPAARQTHPG